ncbi:AI-2E family transporter [Paenibacillus macerans]|nr:AI-2E family transporter [Paenibacillus macerans]MCY7561386.1 AI-2E family transporter [Paenibacillus macerans]MEC0136081.1 AI-2E family transporter [Paenibacillus macerans]MEC0149502.1 AI-2E family transporter [Paenibacillus macerans]UMV50547.1 AI-2E family transporter [Paenibacillus macerans]
MISAVLVPLLLAGFFYYLLRPAVDFLERRKVKRTLAILLLYVVMLIVAVAFIVGVWPPLQTQMVNLLQNVPNLLDMLNVKLNELAENQQLSFLHLEEIDFSKVTEYLGNGVTLLANSITGLVSLLSNFAIALFTFPIILYYLLKDGQRFGVTLAKMFPRRYRGEALRTVREIDNVLNNYIVGRVIVNVALGILMLIGFWILGLPYALLLTVIAVIMNFVPIFGAIISAIPIVLIGLIESPYVGIWSLVIILAAQQIQDNLISPYVFGKTLDIHPVTTILLILGSGKIFGIIGMLLIVPIYMILKILWKKLFRLLIKQQNRKKSGTVEKT